MCNVGIYSVGREGVSNITNWQNRMFCGYLAGRLYLQDTCENHLSWLFAFQSCAEHMLHFTGRLLASYPRKLLWSSIALSLHTLSYTQPLQWNPTNNTGYIRLNVITIKFGTELKPTQNSCKSQHYKYKYKEKQVYLEKQ